MSEFPLIQKKAVDFLSEFQYNISRGRGRDMPPWNLTEEFPKLCFEYTNIQHIMTRTEEFWRSYQKTNVRHVRFPTSKVVCSRYLLPEAGHFSKFHVAMLPVDQLPFWSNMNFLGRFSSSGQFLRRFGCLERLSC